MRQIKISSRGDFVSGWWCGCKKQCAETLTQHCILCLSSIRVCMCICMVVFVSHVKLKLGQLQHMANDTQVDRLTWDTRDDEKLMIVQRIACACQAADATYSQY